MNENNNELPWVYKRQLGSVKRARNKDLTLGSHYVTVSSDIFKTEVCKCCSKHTALLKMTFQTDVLAEIRETVKHCQAVP